MLAELRIRDYLVIENLTLEPGPGLTALSGETGAGKSIVVGAISLLLGARASAGIVRVGAIRALIEAVFHLPKLPEVTDGLAEWGIDCEDKLLVLRREVAKEGRNRAWINGSPATVRMVGELGAALVDIHGQNQQQSLAKASVRTWLLDAYAGSSELRARVAEMAAERDWAVRELASLENRLEEIRERTDFLRFRLEEIAKVRPMPGEDVELTRQARLLEHSQDLAEGAAKAHLALYEGENSAYERVGEARLVLERLAVFDPELSDWSGRLAEAELELEEVGRVLGDYYTGIDHDPHELAGLHARLDELQKLKRRYGPSLDDVLELAESCHREMDELHDPEGEIRERRATVERVETELSSLAGRLSLLRTEAADRLGTAVEEILPALGLEGARFVAALRPRDRITTEGAESVQFLVSTNPGFEPVGLGKVASGGELSRVMLALKSVLATADRTPVLIFDEIDAGVGGAVAGRLGRKLRQLGEDHQVLVVTHLAQVASEASRHFMVQKRSPTGFSTASLQRLKGTARTQEIARMLGGDTSSASMDHAREMLRLAEKGSEGPC